MENESATAVSDESFVSEQRRLQNLRAEVDILWAISEISSNTGVSVPEMAAKLRDIASRI